MKNVLKKIIVLFYLSIFIISIFVSTTSVFAQTKTLTTSTGTWLYPGDSRDILVQTSDNKQGVIINFPILFKTCTTYLNGSCSIPFSSTTETTEANPFKINFTADGYTSGEIDMVIDKEAPRDAVTPPPTPTVNTDTTYQPLAPLPDGSSNGGMLTTINTQIDKTTNPCPFGNYLNIIIKLVIGIAAVLAMVMIVMGGVEYMTSELVSSKEAGKETITHAILGLLLALGAFMILNTINPQLLSACLNNLKDATLTIEPETELVPQTEYYHVTGTTAYCKEGYVDVAVPPPGKPSQINVCKSVSENLARLLAKAKEDGLILSGSGSRSYDDQVKMRIANKCPDIYNSPSTACNPDTAKPGTSMHERGLAIDFNCNGSPMGRYDHNNVCYIWLAAHAEASFGLKNYPREAWHWSTNGH